MLKLTLLPDEYLTINGDIVVQLKRVAGGRADVAVDAPREMPVVRGTLLERQGGERPACLAPPARKKGRTYRDQIFRWNDDRERAVRAMRRALDLLEQNIDSLTQRLTEKGYRADAKLMLKEEAGNVMEEMIKSDKNISVISELSFDVRA